MAPMIGKPDTYLLPDATEVLYHGSRTEKHGSYYASRCECSGKCGPHNRSCVPCKQGRYDECPTGGVRYLVGGNGTGMICHVRRSSITPVHPEELTRPARIGDKGWIIGGHLQGMVVLENDLNPDMIAVKIASVSEWVHRRRFSRVKSL